MGDWRYSKVSDSPGVTSQIYSLTFSSFLTNTISVGSTLRYSRQDQDITTRENFSPTAFLSLRNDFFNLNLSATDSERRNSQGPDFTSRSWNIDLSSYYKEIVNTRVYYGSSKEFDWNKERTNTKTNYWGLNLAKQWQHLQLNYDYRGSKADDYINRSQSKNFSHLLRGQYSGVWKKLSYNLSQQFNYTDTKWEGTLIGGEARYLLPNIEVTWEDYTPSDGDNLNVYINDVKDWQPGDTPDKGIVIDLGTESLDRIEFYYDSVDFKEIPPDIKWDIYWSYDETNWHLLYQDVSLPYDFPTTFSTARYIKLVPRNTSATDPLTLNQPEFRLYKILSAPTYESSVKSYRTDISLGYQLIENLNLNYYFSNNRSEPTPGRDSKDNIHNLSLSWFYNKYLQPRTAVSVSTQEREKEPTIKVKNFSFSNYSQILPTLSTSLGFTHSITKEGGEKNSRSDTINFNSAAEIFPDLNLRLDITLSDNYNYISSVSTKGYSQRLYVVARIKPQVVLSTTYQLDYTDSSLGGSDTTHSLLVDLSWTLSEVCSVHITENIKKNTDETTLDSTYSIWLSPSANTQLNVQYSGRINGESYDNISGFFSWKIGRHFSLKSNVSWNNQTPEGQWSWMINLTANF
ncbi:hypothetical protein [Thermodesulfatator atlanticus]|uniref:hypothetical protein n=1 Tax=Thermodesulfatator atlanticus TaxID=501497 RepID=UPI0012FB006F|nr:hypothetical protein [Thermodesulfatator atlanticus]